MTLLTDLFYAVILAGLPLMALTFAVIWWALQRGRLSGESVGELQKSIESLGKRRKSAKKKKADAEADDSAILTREDFPDEAFEFPSGEKKLDPVLDKWFSFGGGFYGLVALYTWIIIEWNEVWNFVSGAFTVILRFDLGALINLAVNLFIESIMNFVTAIAWPVYWLSVADNPWLWIAVAYGGYWLGIKAAQQVSGKVWDGGLSNLAASITRRDDDDQ